MKRIKNIIFKIVGIISLVVFVVFSTLLLTLNMLPTKYLTLFFVIFIILYLMFLIFIFVKKMKKKLKIIAVIFLTLFALIFGVGIKYLSETIDFVNVFGNELLQKEEYFVMVPSNRVDENLMSLQEKNIGVYDNINSDKVVEELSKELKFNVKKYKNILDMFEALEENKISAVIINNSIKNLLDTELKDMHFEIKQIHTFAITIKKVETVKVVDVINTPFNVYIAGGDAYGDIGNVTNTDVNMIATVDPINKKILLTSIPRDYYVNLPSFGKEAYDKLTHAGYYGIEESILAVEKLLDIEINYYIKVNFSTIEGIIDAIGGVDIYSDFSFCISGDINLCYKNGYNHLKGYKALMFARERHSFADGDIQRVKNQQKVLEAIINKVTNSTAIITNYSEILESVSNNLSTNLDSKSINRLVKMQLNDMKMWNIESQNLIGTDYSGYVYTFPGQELYVMKADEQSVKNATSKIYEIIDSDK